MKALSIKNISEALYQQLKERAVRNHRSLNGEVMAILERTVADTASFDPSERTDFLRDAPLCEADFSL
jgi:plasmid stability protein